MRKENGQINPGMGRGRSLVTWGATLALLTAPLGMCTGCEDQVKREFINASLSSLEEGLQTIVSGIITGAAAVVEQDLEGNSGSPDRSTQTGS